MIHFENVNMENEGFYYLFKKLAGNQHVHRYIVHRITTIIYKNLGV